MRRNHVPALAAAMLLLGGPLFGRAAAQGANPYPTSVPTVVSTVTPPSAAKLIKQMYVAVDRAGSAHISRYGQFVDPGILQGTQQGEEDVSIRAHHEHYIGRTAVTALSSKAGNYTETEEDRIIGHTQAQTPHVGEPLSGVWSCQYIPGDLTRSWFIVYEWKHLTRQKLLGAAMVDGHLTWHVTATAITKEPKKHRTDREPVDYYIDQTSHLLVRELSSAAWFGPNGSIPYTLVLDYASYGERVPVTLPRVCRKK